MNEIYLCDENPSWLQRIEHAIDCFLVKSDWNLSVVCRAQSPRQLLSMLESQGTRYGIYFLDAEYKNGMNGLAFGKEIRRLDRDAFLIYVTAREDMARGMALETFRLNLQVLDFIVKDSEDFQDQVCQNLEYIDQRLASGDAGAESLILSSGSSYSYFPQNDIYFIESVKNSHYIELHTVSGILRYPATIRECRAKLREGFFLCRRGCLVNFQHISLAERQNRTLLLDNGECCHCSVQQWGVLVRQYIRKM